MFFFLALFEWKTNVFLGICLNFFIKKISVREGKILKDLTIKLFLMKFESYNVKECLIQALELMIFLIANS